MHGGNLPLNVSKNLKVKLGTRVSIETSTSASLSATLRVIAESIPLEPNNRSNGLE